MDKPFVFLGLGFFVILMVVFGIAYLGYSNDTTAPPPCDQDVKYHILVLEKLPTESTGGFFDRTRVTIDCLSGQQYIVYSFLPLFDVDTPTIVGATIMYEVKK